MNSTVSRQYFAHAAFAFAIVLALGIAQRSFADDDSPGDSAEAAPPVENQLQDNASVVDDEEARFLSEDSELGPDVDLDSEVDSFVTPSFSYLSDETASTDDGNDDSDDVSAIEWSAGIDVRKKNGNAKEGEKQSAAPEGNIAAGTSGDAIVDLGDMDFGSAAVEQVSEDTSEGTASDANAKPPASNVPATETAAASTGSVAEAAPGAFDAVAVTNETVAATTEGVAAPVEENAAATASGGNAHDGAVVGPVQDTSAAKEETQKAASEEIHGQRNDESSEFQRMVR